jgi:gliding motility-associated-like protein
LFYIPTAFTPGKQSPGLNDVFKPEGVFIDFDDYKFEVYNRWGERVFNTENFEQGWDGTIDGKEAPSGSYIYIVQYQSSDGKEFQQKGTVTITR